MSAEDLAATTHHLRSLGLTDDDIDDAIRGQCLHAAGLARYSERGKGFSDALSVVTIMRGPT